MQCLQKHIDPPPPPPISPGFSGLIACQQNSGSSSESHQEAEKPEQKDCPDKIKARHKL